MPASTVTRRKPVLEGGELARAILVDYEGNKPAPGADTHTPPTLLGYMIDSEVAAGIVESLFAESCAAKYRARHAVAEVHRDLVTRLLARAEHENRVIVSWSEHDLKHMTRAAPEMAARLLAVYRNAIKPAKRYLCKQGIPLRKGQARLYRVCEILQIPVVGKYGEGLVGQGLGMIRKQLESQRGYGDLTPAARHAWQNIIKHNQQDLVTMKAVLERVFASPDSEGA